jgi:hypothetical protein
MNRINFIRHLFLGGAAALAAKFASAGNAEKATDVYLDSLYIAGFQYYKGAEAEMYFKEDDLLVLQRQPKNPHDYFAVEVYHGNNKLGYLPRTGNKVIARMMDQGVSLHAKIRSIDPDAHPYRKVKVRVYGES